jgi:hypothetical protein
VDNVMQAPLGTRTILKRMEEVRCDLDEDVQEIVEGARGMGKWRHYVSNYPWICLAAAFAGGYLIVPRRALGMQPVAKTLADLTTPTVNARGVLLALVGNLAMRAVESYLGQQSDKLFAAPPAKSPQNDQR